MTPVIGITTYDTDASWRGWAARAAVLPYVYVDAVRCSGGRAVLLPPGGDDAEASATVAGLDGLVVTGGPDIDPVRYGAPRHPRTQPPPTLRDAWDLAVTGHALRLGVPLLAVCRGMQVLNVYRGGPGSGARVNDQMTSYRSPGHFAGMAVSPASGSAAAISGMCLCSQQMSTTPEWLRTRLSASCCSCPWANGDVMGSPSRSLRP